MRAFQKSKVLRLSTAILALSTIGMALRNVQANESSAVGIYTGTFKNTTEQGMAKKAYNSYFKKTYGVSLSDGDCCDQLENKLNRFPAPIRPFLFKNPLSGFYQLIQPTHLTIVIDDLRDDHTFSGRSIAAGNERELTGQWAVSPKGYQFGLVEPADKKHDGTFNVSLNTKTNSLTGRWTPYETTDNAKDFVLKKTEFKYQPDVGYSYTDANPSLELLKSSDVENLSKQEIRYSRNLIYARHGYAFSKLETRQAFEEFDWYVPLKSNVDADLTDIEKKNIDLLNRYESYAQERYTEFGR